MFSMLRVYLLVLLSGLAPLTLAAECRVHDPELQGVYQGTCNRQGWAEGRGMAESETARYEGEFRAGKKEGVGVKTWKQSGDEYRGSFRDDFRHGWGRYVWGAGSKWPGEGFEGEFVRDRRHGYGVYFWPNGDKFQGRWRKDVQLGDSFMNLPK